MRISPRRSTGSPARSPRRAVLTNMHIDLDYDTVEAETPAHITPAYDGMTIDLHEC